MDKLTFEQRNTINETKTLLEECRRNIDFLMYGPQGVSDEVSESLQSAYTHLCAALENLGL